MFKAVRSKKVQTRLPVFHFLFMVSLLGGKKKSSFHRREQKNMVHLSPRAAHTKHQNLGSIHSSSKESRAELVSSESSFLDLDIGPSPWVLTEYLKVLPS